MPGAEEPAPSLAARTGGQRTVQKLLETPSQILGKGKEVLPLLLSQSLPPSPSVADGQGIRCREKQEGMATGEGQEAFNMV